MKLCATWLASSRVGVSTRTRGRPGMRFVRVCESRSRIGSAKAAVLPVPVWAMPQRSRPARIGEIDCFWIGVGLVWPSAAMARRMDSPRAKSENWFKGYFRYVKARRTDASCVVFCRSGVVRRPARNGLSGLRANEDQGRVSFGETLSRCPGRAPSTALPLTNAHMAATLLKVNQNRGRQVVKPLMRRAPLAASAAHNGSYRAVCRPTES